MFFIPISDPSSLLLFLLEVVLKGSFVLAAAGLATSLLRKSPAAVRHTIWTAALATVLVLPLIVVFAPRVEVGVLPANESQIPVAPGQADAQTREYVWPPDAALRQEQRSAHPGSRSQSGRQETQSATRTQVNAPAATPQPGSPAKGADIDWKLALLAMWMAGSTVVFFRYVIGRIALVRIKRRSEPVADVRFRLAAIKVSRSMGLKRRVRFVWGDSGAMPLTWGWIRPTVLLPQDAREWEADKILSVLRHELAHIKRYDCFVQGLIYLVCAVYWFNPLVWIASAHSRREREIACDDYVLTSGTAGTEYADQLLDIARSLRTRRMSGASAIAMARQTELEGRLMAILSSDRRRGGNTKTGMAATMGFLAVFAIPLAALRPVPVNRESTFVLAEVDAYPGVESGRLPRNESAPGVAPTLAYAPNITADLAPALSLEAEEYLAQVNEIVEKATRTLESIGRLDPTASAWKVEFGDVGGGIALSVLGQVIANPDTITLAQIKRLEAAGVDVEYIERLSAAGLNRLSVDQLISLAHADVDTEFVTAMAGLGYEDLEPDELIRMSHADVDPEFVAEMKRSGYTDLSAEQMIRLSHAEVGTDFLDEMRKTGLKKVTVDDLVRLIHAGVDADFIQELRDLGLDVDDVDEVVRIKYMDIEPEYIQRVRKALEDN